MDISSVLSDGLFTLSPWIHIPGGVSPRLLHPPLPQPHPSGLLSLRMHLASSESTDTALKDSCSKAATTFCREKAGGKE